MSKRISIETIKNGFLVHEGGGCFDDTYGYKTIEEAFARIAWVLDHDRKVGESCVVTIQRVKDR